MIRESQQCELFTLAALLGIENSWYTSNEFCQGANVEVIGKLSHGEFFASLE